jgi:hypothetical protein
MGHDDCPTCGTKLGSLRDHAHARVCTSCQRANPRGFHYCGFCAAPMENTELRGRIAKAAAPPGGWPSLARELLEVRFFLERGDVGEAFEMVQLLRQRWPGHPQLEEFHGMSPTTRPKRVHTGVNEVVDAVLAGSADWASRAAPRRAAPRWQAPATSAPGRRTQSHEVVEGASPEPRASVPEGGVRKRVEDGSGLRERDTRRGHRTAAAHPVVPVINPAFRDSGPQAIVAEAAAPVAPVVPPARTVAPPPAAGPATRARASAASRPSTTGPQAAARPAGKQRIVQDDDTAVFHRAPAVQPDRAVDAQRTTAPQLVPPEPPPGLSIDPNFGITPADGTPQLVAASGSLDTSDDVDASPPIARVQVRARAEAPAQGESASGDRTVVGPAPTRGPGWAPPRGLTMAVDALQPARPFGDEGEHDDAEGGDDEEVETVRRAADGEAEAPPRRKVRGKAQAKKKAKRRPVAIENDDDPDSAEKREAQAKRRAAKFGQSIVGR